jgi:nitrite reductase/ring-hydroxylating ferredoxin subunit
LYWDTGDPYHYVRVVSDSVRGRDVLLVGGEDHRTGRVDDAEKRYVRLESWARDRFPGVTDVTHCWSGQVLEPSDGLAHIGRESGGAANAYVATGFSGNGMTYGTLAGRLIADLILGRANPWEPLYDPARITAGAAVRYLKLGVDTLAQYGERVSSGEVGSPAEVPAGTGAVMRRGLSKLAIYKDAAGGVQTFSAVCPHLGCIVHWNGSEKTWDCPCHGSRFASGGAVLDGPATRPLSPVVDEAAASLSNLSGRTK